MNLKLTMKNLRDLQHQLDKMDPDASATINVYGVGIVHSRATYHTHNQH